jgi:uncharacterized integral membrane protein (TIGR00697 family)
MLYVVIALFTSVDIVSNVIASKLVAIGPLVVPAATFLFPLAFTLVDLVNRAMGKVVARWVVLGAFAGNVVLVASATIAVALPPAGFWPNQEAYALILGAAPRVVLASWVAYLASSMTDVEVFARLTALPLWGRVMVSSAISLLIDSIIFVGIAFGPLPQVIASQYLIKLVMSVVGLPLILLARFTVAPRMRESFLKTEAVT